QMISTDTSTIVQDRASLAGLDTPSRILAVSRPGRVVFKQNQRAFFLYDEHRDIHVVQLPELYGRYEKLQVFDALFIDDDALAIVFQNGPNGEYFVTRATIDIPRKEMQLGDIHGTGIRHESHKRVLLTRDEKGPILLTHKIGIVAGETTSIELFHVANFLNAGCKGSKLTVTTKPCNSEGVFTSAFVSRNVLYLFFSLDYSKCLVIPLAGHSCGKSEARSTKGTPPAQEYMVKTLEVFDDFLLVYSNQSSIRNQLPVMHLLDLTYLRWQRLVLQLSDHAPAGNISLRAPSHDADWAWLHGNCNRPDCAQRTHLYQIDVSHLEFACRSRSSSLSSLLIANGGSSSSLGVCQATPPSLQATPPSSSKVVADPPVVTRFKKHSKQTRSHSFSALAEEMGDASTIAATQRRDRPPSVHWAEDMDGAAAFDLKDQIKQAKEMGYTDDAVHRALRRNTGDEESPYKRFSDINSMLDLLNKSSDDKGALSHSSSSDSNYSPSCDRSSLSGRTSSRLSLDERPALPMKMSVYRDQGSRTNRSCDSPRSASVSRSASFQLDSRSANKKTSAAPVNDIERLMKALDKEHDRNMMNQMEQIKLLVEKVEKMKREQSELEQKLNEKILAELQLEKQLKDQKELEEYRRTELIEKNERIQGELSAASEERDQMRSEMQDHIHRETELQAMIEEKEKVIQDMIENAGSISRRNSVFRPHCIICLEKWPNIVFSKCMHLAVCEECYEMASNNPSAPLKTCPTCREPITGSLKVYM
ncbi:hypothetical protein PMAYCL1PPCAC_30279, partial [Pristionchus mayeri]